MFMVAVGLGVLALHLYLWKRLVRDTTTSARARRVATIVLAVFAGLAVAALVLPRFVGVEIAKWFAWPGYLWLALFFYLLLVLAALELPRLALRRWTRPAESGEVDESRRLFLSRAAGVVAVATAGSVVGAGAVSALGPPTVKRVSVPIGRLAPGLRGMRIAVVSDIHLGPLLGRSHTEQIVRMLNETRPDLVAMVGDLADGTVAELGHAAAPLGDLVAPTYFVTGNHEYYSGYQPWVTELERLGLHYLHNENTKIVHGLDRLTLAGVTDVTGKNFDDGPDMERALTGRVGTTVLLAHQPVQAEKAATLGVDLQLSGHTHGGQLWPFHYVVRAAQPAVSGLSKVDKTWLYVTNGVGTWGPPVRVGAAPDISVIELAAD